MDVSKNKPNPTIIIERDFTAGNINWDDNLVESHSRKRFVHEEFLRILDVFHLIQHQRDPTKLGRLLNLFYTSKLAIVQIIHTTLIVM